MTVYAITDTKKGRTGIAPTYLQTTLAILSVRRTVRNVPVSDENGLTYRHSFFHYTVTQSF